MLKHFYKRRKNRILAKHNLFKEAYFHKIDAYFA